MKDEQLNLFLQAEYLQLRKTIEDIDSRSLTIKAWSVTFSLAAMAGAFVSHSKYPFLIAAMSTVIFWMLEALWKLFQISHYDRLILLEKHFRGEIKAQHPFQVGTSWYRAWKRDRLTKMFRVAIWPHVALPHFLVFVTAIALYYLVSISVVNLNGSA